MWSRGERALLLLFFCELSHVSAWSPVVFPVAPGLCISSHRPCSRLPSLGGRQGKARFKNGGHQGRPLRLFASSSDLAAKVVGSDGVCGDIDPMFASVLLRAAGNVRGFDLRQIAVASAGLQVWKSALIKGRLPVKNDFADVDSDTWPQNPLFFHFSGVLAELQLPRFVLRHPDTANAVLLSMLQLSIDFVDKAQEIFSTQNRQDGCRDGAEAGQESPQSAVQIPSDGEEMRAIAAELAEELTSQWAGVVGGVRIMDQLFGAQHGLLDAEGGGGGGGGFGVDDGVWRHSGWRAMPDLQRRVSSMQELRHLISLLGRRASARGANLNKFAPQVASEDSQIGVANDPSARTSVNGLTLSSSLTEMLPSEAVLLKGTSPTLRRLFLAKKVEAKLLSYELSGWVDTGTRPRERPQYFPHLPSAPGGPLIVCLDTSWSMTGEREQLAKAVVLACITAANQQRRACHVVAFSSANDVMECGRISCDAAGIRRLLDFLANSFEGGTDVTGALKHAIQALGTEAMAAADVLLLTDGELPNPPVSEDVLASLERLRQRTGMEVHGLLVGKAHSDPLEILCTQTHNFLCKYDLLQSQGASAAALTSPGLQALPPYELSLLHARPDGAAGNSHPFSRRASCTLRTRQGPIGACRGWGSVRRAGCGARALPALRAKASIYSDEDALISRRPGKGTGKGKGKKGQKKERGSKRLEDEDWSAQEYEDNVSGLSEDAGDDDGAEAPEQEQDEEFAPGPDATPRADFHSDFNSRVENAAGAVSAAVAALVEADAWSVQALDEEKDHDGSCWRFHDQLKTAVGKVSKGLVEREEEARLVVLGMVAQEHVLLLGPPGTGKSALGQRIAHLCGGAFFQRLLTRFTTPEELFGPLSLRALENDEYRRCTEGFLPTASIGFLDEIFKANSAILNTLLTILNERQFDNGAGQREECPIRCVIGASNELPESDELDALYDRFLIRKEVLPVSDAGLMGLLTAPPEAPASEDAGGGTTCNLAFADGLDELAASISTAAATVVVGENVAHLLRDLRAYMAQEHQAAISDRRLVQAVRLLRVCAACHGRRQIDAIDCLLLQHVVWRLPEQRSAVREWLWQRLTPGASPEQGTSQFRFLLDGIRQEAMAAVRKTTGDVTGAAGARDEDVAAIAAFRHEACRLADLLQRRSDDIARHTELLHRAMQHIWLDPDEARAAQQLLLPKAQAVAEGVSEALADARALSLCLDGAHDAAPGNDIRLSVLEMLWEEEVQEVQFTEEDLKMGMKEAKAKYDADTFRSWKRARKKAA